jgi:hypothetical protein
MEESMELESLRRGPDLSPGAEAQEKGGDQAITV